MQEVTRPGKAGAGDSGVTHLPARRMIEIFGILVVKPKQFYRKALESHITATVPSPFLVELPLSLL